jgi:hypothetical protein
MDPVLIEAFNAIKDAYSSAGLLGGLAALLMILVRVYRSGFVSNLLPAKARWASLPKWAKVALPFLLAGGGATLSAILGGVPVLSAIISGIAVGLAAIGGHHATKAAGAALDSHALKNDPFGDTSNVRKAFALLLPMSKVKAEAKDDAKP